MTINERAQRNAENASAAIEDGRLSAEGPYTTIGSVRGDCGHKHRNIWAAARCLANDQAGCASQGGYSDRRITEAS